MTEHTDRPASACLTLEQVAAFVDGGLPTAERNAVLTHLARCPDCRHLVAETMHAAADLRTSESTTDAKPARVTEITKAKSRATLARRTRPWLLVAAASATCTFGALVALRLTSPPTAPSRQDLIASLELSNGVLGNLWTGSVTRGGVPDSPRLDAVSGELGVLLIDLDVAVGAGDAEEVSKILRRIATLLEPAGLFEADVEMLRQLAAEPNPTALIAGARAVTGVDFEDRLRRRFSPHALDLGALAEATRLGSQLGRSLARSQSVERYLRWVGTSTASGLRPEVRDRARELLAADGPVAEREAAERLLSVLTEQPP